MPGTDQAACCYSIHIRRQFAVRADRIATVNTEMHLSAVATSPPAALKTPAEA